MSGGALSEAEILARSDLNLLEFWRESTRRAPGGEVVDRDGVLLASGASEFPVLINLAMRADPEIADEAVIATADAYFGALGRGYTLLVRDHSEQALGEVAMAAGFTALGEPGPWLVLDERLPDADPPDGLDIRRVANEEEVAQFARVAADSFATYGMPPDVLSGNVDPRRWLDPHLLVYLGLVEGQPVACSACVVSHGVAGIYFVGTVPDARGRGYAEALTRVAGNAGFDEGCRFASLQASVMGDPIYRRMGYRQIGAQRSLVRFTPPTECA